MTNIWNWLITSSANPEQTSLTIKGLLVGIAPIAVILLHLDTANYGALVDAIAGIIFWAGSILSAIMTIYGVMRKISFGRWSAPQ